MGRVCVILVAGLDAALVARVPGLGVLGGLKHCGVYRPVFPAVTSTAQATLTTGAAADAHGIICNGLYTHGDDGLRDELDLTSHADARVNVSFWEQSNGLLELPRFWHGSGKKTAMLFWQNSMPGQNGPAADIVITPKPVHTADGKTLTACWSAPDDLYGKLAAELGPFPLHNYWSPMAGLPSSEWIMKAAGRVWTEHAPDLQLVYVPHLDFNLLRLGPNHAAVEKDLRDVDALLAPFVERVRADGGTVVIAGDYGMSDVSTPVLPNLALRREGLLATATDAAGKLIVDYERSQAFVMADHQVGFLYVKPDVEHEALHLLRGLPGVEKVLRGWEELLAVGLGNRRAGQGVMVAKENAWFAHDWWENDGEKPAWQFGVDIHNKPGFDPRELFFDRERKCIQQDAALVKGSHGLTADRAKWPVVMSDAPLPEGEIRAQELSPWLAKLLAD